MFSISLYYASEIIFKGGVKMCLAKNIRYLRKQHNYSQDYIAEKLGYKSYTTIQKWEMGVSEPPVTKLKELANLFNVDINDMTTKDMEKMSNNKEYNYYSDEETRDLVQFLHENQEYKVLFDASRKVKKKDIDFVKQVIDRIVGDATDTEC